MYVLIGNLGYEDTWAVATSDSATLIESLASELDRNWDGTGNWQPSYGVCQVDHLTTFDDIKGVVAQEKD